MDHFEVFGLPRRFAIDAAELQRRFYQLSRQYHPDRHHQDSPAGQARALEASARLNAAYRALRDPIDRIEYLLRLHEASPGGGAGTSGDIARGQAGSGRGRAGTPPALLAELFEIQEALDEARAGGLDEASRRVLADQRARLEARYGEEEARLRGPLAEAWDRAGEVERAGVMDAVRSALAARAYLRTVIDDLSTALGDREAHVAHHRH
jgi:molecular chaperone HscB